MKRSEMAYKLAKLLHEKAVMLDEENGTYNVYTDFHEFKDVWIDEAYDVLDLLESNGMHLCEIWESFGRQRDGSRRIKVGNFYKKDLTSGCNHSRIGYEETPATINLGFVRQTGT